MRNRRTSRLVLGGTLTLLLVACSQSSQPGATTGDPYVGGRSYPWSDRLDLPGANPYANGRSYAWTGPTAGGSLSPQALSGDNFLSDLTWTGATNAWGPAEKDRSNGEQAAGDGKTLTIGGQTFAKGLGVHADSTVSYALGGSCQTFTASVGIDDEVGDRGSAAFQVYADGVKLFDSGVLRGTDTSRSVSVSVSGKNELKLVVTSGGDNINYDHADWAGARVSCTAPAPTQASFVSDLAPSSATNGWGPFEKDRSNGEQALGDGQTLTVGGQTFQKGLGVHASSTLTYPLQGRCTTFNASVGIDDEVGDRGSVVFQVFADGVKVADSGVVRGTDGARFLSADVTSRNELKLVVTSGGDNLNYDHADWAGAKLTCQAPPSGSVDSTWTMLTTPLPADKFVADAVLEPEGSFLINGSRRLLQNGTVQSFGTDGIALEQADGRIVVMSDLGNGTFVLRRYLHNLTPDTSFGQGGQTVTDLGGGTGSGAYVAYDAALQPDGRIVVVGNGRGEASDFAVVRFTPNGLLDTSFGQGGRVLTSLQPLQTAPVAPSASEDVARAVAIGPGGTIVVAGTYKNVYCDKPCSALVRYAADGSLDRSFGWSGLVNGGYNVFFDKLAVEPNGDILVDTSSWNGSSYSGARVSRVRADGSSGGTTGDFYLGPNGTSTGYNKLSDMVLQADGRIVLGGATNGSSGSAVGVLVRLKPDLTLDTSFGTGGRVVTEAIPGGVRRVLLQPDGKILVVGQTILRFWP